MPAAYGKDLCFEHHSRLLRMRVKPATPDTFVTVPLVRFVYPEDHDCILENVHAVARALAHCAINDRVASVMDRLMNTALRTLRQGQKLEKTVTCDEMIRHFRLDGDGHPRAAEPVAYPIADPIVGPPAESAPQPIAEAPQPAIIPVISAQAEEPAQPEPGTSAELRRITNSQNLSALLSTLADGKKLKNLLSNTYIFRNGKLIVAPVRHRISPEPTGRNATAYIFLTNMR
jgi:hypothetical protein